MSEPSVKFHGAALDVLALAETPVTKSSPKPSAEGKADQLAKVSSPKATPKATLLPDELVTVSSPRVKPLPSPTVIVTADQPSPLVPGLARALMDRLREMTFSLRNDIELKVQKDCISRRQEPGVFLTAALGFLENTIPQEFYRFADERQAEFAQLWVHYNAYKRTKPKENMSKRQFIVLIRHWLTALSQLEAETSNTASRDDDAKARTSRSPAPRLEKSHSFLGFGTAKRTPSPSAPKPIIITGPEVVEELKSWCYLGTPGLLPHCDLVANAAWERIYVHDAAFGLNPRGDPTASPGCQAKFILNFCSCLRGLKHQYGAVTTRPSTAVLQSCYDFALKKELSHDKHVAYTRHLERTGLM